MTCEVVLMNSLAVAMAADSLVTVQVGKDTKTYAGALKLFTLSKSHPVGIMLFNSADLLGVPWETIIKLFRAELADNERARVEDYASDFLSFVNRFMNAHIDDRSRLTSAGRYGMLILHKVLHEAAGAFVKAFRANRQTANLDALIKAELESFLEETNGVTMLSCFDGISEADFKQEIGMILDAMLISATKISSSRIVNQVDTKAIPRDLAIEVVYRAFRCEHISDAHSGVVIAGFGGNEFLPAMAGFHIDQLLWKGKLKTTPIEVDAVEIGGEAIIGHFADAGAVENFIDGIHPEFRDYLVENISELISGMVDLTLQVAQNSVPPECKLDEHVAGIREKMLDGDGFSDAMQAFYKKVEDFEGENFSGRFRSAIGLLPKDDLAATAQALVELSSLKHKISPALESVGGPVDVAVITKGDGFVWISRKHYFRPELNPHFTRNYFRVGAAEEGKQK